MRFLVEDRLPPREWRGPWRVFRALESQLPPRALANGGWSKLHSEVSALQHEEVSLFCDFFVLVLFRLTFQLFLTWQLLSRFEEHDLQDLAQSTKAWYD